VPAPARARLRPILRPVLWTVLGAWLGALLLFGGVFVRVVFQTVPDPDVAGHLVGRMLGPLQLAGAAAGLLLAALGGALRRGVLAVVLPLLLSGAALLNHFSVSPAVARIRLTDPAAGPDVGLRFSRLHHLSVLLFSTVAVGAVLLALLHGLREAREETHEEAPRSA
jgi:hypothetical protein